MATHYCTGYPCVICGGGEVRGNLLTSHQFGNASWYPPGSVGAALPLFSLEDQYPPCKYCRHGMEREPREEADYRLAIAWLMASGYVPPDDTVEEDEFGPLTSRTVRLPGHRAAGGDPSQPRR